ncbi:MAG: type VI secretion system tip protein VgrG [Magnetococcales bacterium]|nr:type VI secretion system tip protein VgrG [Magnetococcales bacterium]
MSAVCPLLESGKLVTYKIKVDGADIQSTIEVESITTRIYANRIPKARLVLYDGSGATGDFEISNMETFIPGKKVDINIGYDSKEETVFSGIIIKQGIEIFQNQGSKLIVDISDEALKMTLERKNGYFAKIKDGDLIAKLITNSGLQKDVDTTDIEHEEIIQYDASDWDTMLSRAEINSLIAIVASGKVSVKKPDTSLAADLVVKYGKSILDLNIEMDATNQYKSSTIKSYSWDSKTQKVLDSPPESVSFTDAGNIDTDTLAKVLGVKEIKQQTGGFLDKGSLKSWSSGQLLKSKLARICGTVRFQGSAKAVTGKTIELDGLGERFNGTVFISGVEHTVQGGRWLTNVTFGMKPQWFSQEASNIAAPGAAGQLPPIKGLQTAVVKKVAVDDAGEYRVQIKLNLIQDDTGVWARLGSFYASDKVGAVFFPEVDDEVIVGFMNQDPRYPIILGSVYSKKHAPAYPPDEKNNKKAIVTRSKLEITFDDKDKIIEINTPGKHTITMDDKATSITIQDTTKNKIEMSKSGIVMDSPGNIDITAKGNITIAADGNLATSAKLDATMEGMQVTHTAKTKFSATGSASAELTSSAMATIQGGLVKIN